MTHVLLQRQTDRAEALALSEQVRQERIAIYSEFAEAVAELRGACQHRQIMREKHGLESTEFGEARAWNHRVQPAARGAMYRVHLIADDPQLVSLSTELMAATIAVRDAEGSADLQTRSDRSRDLTDAFVAAAASQLHR
jgi:hypothetical protein